MIGVANATSTRRPSAHRPGHPRYRTVPSPSTDTLKTSPELRRWRPAVGITPKLSDAELLTVAVMQALLGYTSEAGWLRYACTGLHNSPSCDPSAGRVDHSATLPVADGVKTWCWRAAFQWVRRPPSRSRLGAVTRAGGSDAGQARAAGEPGCQLCGIQTESLEEVRVLVGVDPVRELLVGLVGALVVAALAEQIQDRVLVELHTGSLLALGWVMTGMGRDASAPGCPAEASRRLDRPSGRGAVGWSARL